MESPEARIAAARARLHCLGALLKVEYAIKPDKTRKDYVALQRHLARIDTDIERAKNGGQDAEGAQSAEDAIRRHGHDWARLGNAMHTLLPHLDAARFPPEFF